MTVTGMGKKLSNGDPLLVGEVAEALCWPCYMATRDNLGVNDCMVAAEEQAALRHRH